MKALICILWFLPGFLAQSILSLHQADRNTVLLTDRLGEPRSSVSQKALTNENPNEEDLFFLKRFFKRSDLWGLYRHLKRKDRRYLTKLQDLHKKFGLKTNHIEEVLEIKATKPNWKLRKSINKSTYWQIELRSFLIKNQVLKYTPESGAILDQRGFRFQF